MKLLILLVALSATFAVGVSQCTREQVVNYVISIDDAQFTCGTAFDQVDTTNITGRLLPTITDRSTPLDTVCTAKCGGAVSNWYRTTCNDRLSADGLWAWCLPTATNVDGRDRCYFAIPPVFDDSVYTTLGIACATAASTAPSCPQACTDALQGFANSVGCCFESLLNNGTYIQGLVDAGALTADERIGLQFFTSLFTACNGVTAPAACEGEAFPGDGAMANVVPLAGSVLALLAVVQMFVI